MYVLCVFVCACVYVPKCEKVCVCYMLNNVLVNFCLCVCVYRYISVRKCVCAK